MAKPRSIPPKVRARVLERDGFKCRRCGAGPSDGALDHVVPVADGGPADESNLQTLCRKCNKGKGASAPGAADLGPRDKVTRDGLAAILGVDVRSVTNFVNEGMPKESRGRYVLSVCVRWYVDRERATASASRGLNDLDMARQRKTVAEARIAELGLAEKEGLSIPLEVHAQRLRERLDTVAGNVKAIGRYHSDVQAATTDFEADALLERMCDELLAELYSLKDTIE